MQTKTFTIGVELKDAQKGAVRAAFVSFGKKDHDGDVLFPSAFVPGQEAPMVWSHQWDKPIGRGRVLVEPDRAVFEGQFNLNTSWGKDAFEAVKFAGDLQEWSFGFQIPPGGSEMGTWQGEPVRLIKGPMNLFEVSPVLKGAGVDTQTLALAKAAGPSAATADLARIRDELRARMARDPARSELRAIKARLDAQRAADTARQQAEVLAARARYLSLRRS